MDTNNETGLMQVIVTRSDSLIPIANAEVEITDASTEEILASETTDENGKTPLISLTTPPLAFSSFPSDNKPYAIYNVRVLANFYDEQSVYDAQVFSGETALQYVSLNPRQETGELNPPIVIGGNTLWEYYPPKIAEASIKPMNETGEIVLRQVVVPETIVVHDGVPSDSTAKNYYVSYPDYIKNVACCEIYSTWPDATIRANVLAIMSFTLNRVYTEWYRNKGYNFTITSSTAYDHKWIYGQTISENISVIVDEMINSYISKPNVKQPILTQYCDGKRVSCPDWMSQWGSKYLGDDGFSASEILRYYYGDEVYINVAPRVAGIPSSYPGYDLNIGSSGEAVTQIQEQLNRIAQNYPSIPKLTVDGIYGIATKNAVSKFQSIFNLPASGIVDYPTWYKISQIYVGVSKIAENV